MAFFPRTVYNTDASFTPLFRLLDDFDSYSRQNGGCSTRRSALQQWQPKFDVREVANAYELHGELPGMTKDNVHIEFTEPQTMVVRGKTERTYTAGSPPAYEQVEDTAAQTAAPQTEEPTNANSHQATVEDEAEAEARESGSEEPVVIEKPTEKKIEKPRDTAKYWLTERSVGEFSRSFHFPTRVDQDAVSASFKDGILSVVVPKAKKHESRRITVN